MAEASIPVDLFNPGQVFACLGFLEAADVLLGEVEGGFDWNKGGETRFHVRINSGQNPFAVVLAYLAGVEVQCYAPKDYTDPPKKTKKKVDASDGDAGGIQGPLDFSETFPSPKADSLALPIRLLGTYSGEQLSIPVSHWADGSGRNDFKLYAGNRSGADKARAMLSGTVEKRSKKQTVSGLKTRGLNALWKEQPEELLARPFDVLTPIGGSFNFDPRRAWTGIDAGYSPDAQEHAIAASPIVEILAAVGLEHARPDEFDTRQVRYAAWGVPLPPVLARAAFGGSPLAIPMRRFRFTLDRPSKYIKIVTFAQEELNA